MILKHGMEQAPRKDSLFYDPSILTIILNVLNKNNSWDIGLAHGYLPILTSNGDIYFSLVSCNLF